MLYWFLIKVKLIHNAVMVSCGKSKMVSYASSIMKNNLFPTWSRFSVKYSPDSNKSGVPSVDQLDKNLGQDFLVIVFTGI